MQVSPLQIRALSLSLPILRDLLHREISRPIVCAPLSLSVIKRLSYTLQLSEHNSPPPTRLPKRVPSPDVSYSRCLNREPRWESHRRSTPRGNAQRDRTAALTDPRSPRLSSSAQFFSLLSPSSRSRSIPGIRGRGRPTSGGSKITKVATTLGGTRRREGFEK